VQLVVRNASGTSAPISARVWPSAPGIFFDAASGMGAILNANSTETTLQRPAPRGGHIEIYCTGLGPVALGPDGLSRTTLQPQVTIGGVTAQVTYSGLAPGFPGLYQVNVRAPQGARSGLQLLQITVAGESSNEVRVGIE
jgi:uncharacterized protein (TIGR03437 family)